MERRNRIKEYIEEILTMGKFDEDKRNKGIAMIVAVNIVAIGFFVLGYYISNNWTYWIGAIVFIYGFIEFTFVMIYWGLYSRKESIDKRTIKGVTIVLISLNILWIFILIIFEKLLTKMRMKIIFQYFWKVIYAIILSFCISFMLIFGIGSILMEKITIDKSYFLRIIILAMAIFFVILYRIILKIAMLWLEKEEVKEKRRHDIKEINEKLDTIGLSIAWFFIIAVNTIGKEKMGVIGSEVVVILGAFSTWVSLRNRWENSKE